MALSNVLMRVNLQIFVQRVFVPSTLREGDEIVFCALSTGNESIIIATAHGQGIRFNETEVRSMGRQAAGVIGIRLKKDDYVVGMEVIADHGDILFATENGYGKRVSDC